MPDQRNTYALAWARRAGLGLLAIASLACDMIDVSTDVPASAGSTATLESNATSTGERSPDMDSIGPDEAQRVYYQFVDDRGRVQFVERLTDVPEAWRAQVGYVEMSQPPPLTPQDARKSWAVSSERAKQIMLSARTSSTAGSDSGGQRHDVVLYSATWCGYCTKARAHLDGAGIDYELRDVDNGAIGRELREKTGRGGVPVLDFSGEILRGYSADQYDRAIRSIRG